MPMPRGPSGNVSITAAISRQEAGVVEAERARLGLRDRVPVMEKALRELLAAGRGDAPFAMPPVSRGDLFVTTFRLSPEVAGLTREAARRYRVTLENVLRAAIHRIAARAAAAQGPTQTGA